VDIGKARTTATRYSEAFSRHCSQVRAAMDKMMVMA
jgi:hypothetical protein